MSIFIGKNDKEEKPATDKLSAREQKALLKKQQAEAAEQAAAEELSAERERLLAMSEKELLVELILEMRGFNDRIKNVEKSAKSAELASSRAALNSSVSALNRR